MEIWTATDEAGEITQDFVGLMAFSVPEKAGYDVTKATLVLHADMVKGDPKFADWFDGISDRAYNIFRRVAPEGKTYETSGWAEKQV